MAGTRADERVLFGSGPAFQLAFALGRGLAARLGFAPEEEPSGFAQSKSSFGGFGAVEWIRTTTVLLPPAPQAGASASSATTALR
jgi:hypothetical protein